MRHDVQFTDEYYYLGFRIMVPSTTTIPPAHENGGDDYMLFQQFWQCSGMPPIAGLALSRDAYKALTGEPDWEPGRPFAWSMVVRTDSNGSHSGVPY